MELDINNLTMWSTHSSNTINSARLQCWETNLGYELPITNASASNSMSHKTSKNMFWVFFNIRLFIH